MKRRPYRPTLCERYRRADQRKAAAEAKEQAKADAKVAKAIEQAKADAELEAYTAYRKAIMGDKKSPPAPTGEQLMAVAKTKELVEYHAYIRTIKGDVVSPRPPRPPKPVKYDFAPTMEMPRVALPYYPLSDEERRHFKIVNRIFKEPRAGYKFSKLEHWENGHLMTPACQFSFESALNPRITVNIPFVPLKPTLPMVIQQPAVENVLFS